MPTKNNRPARRGEQPAAGELNANEESLMRQARLIEFNAIRFWLQVSIFATLFMRRVHYLVRSFDSIFFDTLISIRRYASQDATMRSA